MGASRINNDMAQQPVSHPVPAGGLYINGSGQANNGTTVLYTVPANKLALIYGYTLDINPVAAGYGYLGIYSSAPALLYEIDRLNRPIAIPGHTAVSLCTPIMVNTSESIRVFSSVANLLAYSCIHLYEFTVI